MADDNTSKSKEQIDYSDSLPFLKLLAEKGVMFSAMLTNTHTGKSDGWCSISIDDLHFVITNPQLLVAKYLFRIKDNETIEKFLNNRFQYEADERNVDINKYRTWHEWFEMSFNGCYYEPQCAGTTSKGKRCKNIVRTESPPLDKFIFGYHDRCDLHRSDE
jgi:hypothetical protein